MKTEPTDVLHLTLDAEQRWVGGMAPVKCGLCGALAPARSLSTGLLQGTHGWDCPCGALGVQVTLMDLDEVYEDVLEVWGLPGLDLGRALGAPRLAPELATGSSPVRCRRTSG